MRTSIIRRHLLHLLVVFVPRRARTECNNLVLVIPFELVKRSETDQDIFGGSIAVTLGANFEVKVGFAEESDDLGQGV